MMKYSLKEHPIAFFLFFSLIMLGVSIALAVLYSFSLYTIVAIVISGVGSLALLGYLIYDYADFRKHLKDSGEKPTAKKDEEKKDD
jgi:hypothetical protein